MVLDDPTLDDLFVALSDATRRNILERLVAGEARVTDLAKPYDMSLNSVSKHIRILERARLVTRRKSGRDHFLSLNPEAFNAAADWMQARVRTAAEGSPASATGEKASDIDSFAALMKAEAQTKKKRWSLFGGV